MNRLCPFLPSSHSNTPNRFPGVLLFLLLSLLAGSGCQRTAPPLPPVEAQSPSASPLPALPALEPAVTQCLQQAVERGATPGAVALVNMQGQTLCHTEVGHASLTPRKKGMKKDQIFDLASLTKVVATTTSILMLWDEGKLQLDDPVSKYLPELDRPDKRAITLRHCLSHTTGLPPFQKYYDKLTGREAYLKAIATEPLQYKTGTERRYSDLGFILLGLVVEKVSAQPLDEFARNRIFTPLKMEQTRYLPTGSLKNGSASRYASTEECPWRKRVMTGVVHDENAYALGGVSGHAGLFSTATDLERFGRMLLGHGEYEGVRILSPEAVAQLNTCQSPAFAPQAGLGWLLKTDKESVGGFLSSPRSYGHTGFTGTSLWLDPENQVVAILLTNAVHPSREKAASGSVRLEFHRIVSQATQPPNPPRVQTGLDVLESEDFRPLWDKRIAIVSNQTGINAAGKHIVELMAHHPRLRVTALFGPEHGFTGAASAGAEVSDSKAFGIPVYSLYGDKHKPDAKLASEFDVMVFDMQDVGARFYTYIWTLFYVQQFCAETGKTLFVLDRPNPLGGLAVEGPILEESVASFVGLKPLPIRHGMTVGELARFYNQQGWLGSGLEAKLEVIAMRGWKRAMSFRDTGLTWIPPSPNIPTPETAWVYPGACLFEGVNWSEGRGTLQPFLNVGGPGIDASALCQKLNALQLPGVTFLPTHFTPQVIEGKAPDPRFKNRLCQGVFIRVDDPARFSPVTTGVALVKVFHDTYPDRHEWKSIFNLLAGNKQLREQIEAGKSLENILEAWKPGLDRFKPLRQKALLYETEPATP